MLDSNTFQAQTATMQTHAFSYLNNSSNRYESNPRHHVVKQDSQQMSYFMQRNPYNTPLNLMKLNDRRLSPTLKFGQKPTR